MSRRRRGGHGGGHSSSERWLLTYADLITLLLVFFVVLYSMSITDHKKMYDLQRSLQSAFHVSAGGDAAPLPPGDPNVLIGGSAVLPEVQALMKLQERLEDKIEKENGAGSSQMVTSTLNERGLVVSLANSAFFERGESTLRPGAMGVLKSVAGIVSTSGRHVMIEGHTDNTPIVTNRYPSNWELSTARATTVVRWLITSYHVPPARLSAAGYGEYYPLVGNTSEENRAKNRRVDIVILRSDLKGQRPAGQL